MWARAMRARAGAHAGEKTITFNYNNYVKTNIYQSRATGRGSVI